MTRETALSGSRRGRVGGKAATKAEILPMFGVCTLTADEVADRAHVTTGIARRYLAELVEEGKLTSERPCSLHRATWYWQPDGYGE